MFSPTQCPDILSRKDPSLMKHFTYSFLITVIDPFSITPSFGPLNVLSCSRYLNYVFFFCYLFSCICYASSCHRVSRGISTSIQCAPPKFPSSVIRLFAREMSAMCCKKCFFSYIWIIYHSKILWLTSSSYIECLLASFPRNFFLMF